jgi:hydrogenase-4 component B
MFLGVPRSDEHVAHREAGWQMLLPMVILALLCTAIGLAPSFIGSVLQRASVTAFPLPMTYGVTTLATQVPLSIVSIMGITLLVLLGLIALWYRRKLAAAPQCETITWSCGYQRPVQRIQYSASSFAGMLTSLFAFVLKPQNHRSGRITGIYPEIARFSSHVPETVLELVYIPAFKRLYQYFSSVRRLQSGVLQQYVLYVLITVVILLAASYL